MPSLVVHHSSFVIDHDIDHTRSYVHILRILVLHWSKFEWLFLPETFSLHHVVWCEFSSLSKGNVTQLMDRNHFPCSLKQYQICNCILIVYNTVSLIYNCIENKSWRILNYNCQFITDTILLVNPIDSAVCKCCRNSYTYSEYVYNI